MINDKRDGIVISSRVRLARNFKGFPFPFRLTGDQAKLVVEKAKSAVMKNCSALSKEFNYIPVDSTPSLELQSLIERRLMSPDLAKKDKNAGLLLSKDCHISIMVNEEDHLRIQCIFDGFSLDKAWDLADKVDSLIEENVEYAFNERFGYLTACPTNIGTGLRASVMIHLPALSMSGKIGQLISEVNRLGIAVRGIYGEGSKAVGNMFQISNQSGLGQTEEEIIDNITSIAKQIIDREYSIRDALYKDSRMMLEDKVWRSYGILKHARMISTEETMKLMSDVKLGVEMGIIDNVSNDSLVEIMVMIQPANIQKIKGETSNFQQRDVLRAEYIRERLLN